MNEQKPPKRDIASISTEEFKRAYDNATPLRVVGQGEKKPPLKFDPFPTTPYSEIEPADWEYAIDRVWPLGEVSNLEGYGGDGKSAVICDHEARLSRGHDLPGGLAIGTPSASLHFTTEESPHKTVTKRLRAARADLRLIRNIDLRKLKLELADSRLRNQPRFSFPSGTLRFSQTIEHNAHEMNAPVRLVVIDGVLSTMDKGLEMNNSQHVREYLDALRWVAQEHNVAIVLIRHPSKSRGSLAAHRAAGAGAFHDFVRLSWVVGVEPGTEHEEYRRVFVVNKPNAPHRKGLHFSTKWNQQHNDVEVEWNGDCTLTADEVYAAREERKAADAPLAKADPDDVAKALKVLRECGLPGITPRKAQNLLDGSGVSKQAVWAAIEAIRAENKSTNQSPADKRAGEKYDEGEEG
ncbi:MAG: AAA family ATPase [Deltaproteobacteria bacterium]|nr:AAA family ATPase [Deltaproteobacteria bacterium]